MNRLCGIPHCLPSGVNNRTLASALATVAANESTFRVVEMLNGDAFTLPLDRICLPCYPFRKELNECLVIY